MRIFLIKLLLICSIAIAVIENTFYLQYYNEHGCSLAEFLYGAL